MSGIPRLVLIVAMSAGMSASATVTSRSPSLEATALNSVYFTALLTGRDPDAAVRKARFGIRVLMHQLGVPHSAALADETRFLLRRSGTLCGNG
jgi:hypothetical protein